MAKRESSKTPGQIAYEAYGEAANWLTFDGRPMPRWDPNGKGPSADRSPIAQPIPDPLSASERGRETMRRWEIAALAAMRLEPVRRATEIAQRIVDGDESLGPIPPDAEREALEITLSLLALAARGVHATEAPILRVANDPYPGKVIIESDGTTEGTRVFVLDSELRRTPIYCAMRIEIDVQDRRVGAILYCEGIGLDLSADLRKIIDRREMASRWVGDPPASTDHEPGSESPDRSNPETVEPPAPHEG